MAAWRRVAGRGCTGALASGWRHSTQSSRAVWRPSWRITSKPGPRGRATGRARSGQAAVGAQEIEDAIVREAQESVTDALRSPDLALQEQEVR